MDFRFAVLKGFFRGICHVSPPEHPQKEEKKHKFCWIPKQFSVIFTLLLEEHI